MSVAVNDACSLCESLILTPKMLMLLAIKSSLYMTLKPCQPFNKMKILEMKK